MIKSFLGQAAPFSQIDEVEQVLGKAIRAARKREGRQMQVEDKHRLHEALHAVAAICYAYHTAAFEQVHSVRVRQIESDFQSLRDVLASIGERAPMLEEQEKARSRVKGWQYESRRWIADLPMQAVVRTLPGKDGLTGAARFERLKACWLESGAAFFTPPPRHPGVMVPGVPEGFQIAPMGLAVDWCPDPMDAVVPGSREPKWVCHPAAVLELLDWGREALLLEAGGPDRGGKTTFAQRRRRASLRDAFAFSCIVVYEQAVGAGSARQSQSQWRRNKPTPFEMFVERAYALALGGEIPQGWALGPDPIRKAVATQRAWQKLFRCAGVRDSEAFSALQPDEQHAALGMLKPRVRRLLKPAAPPWV